MSFKCKKCGADLVRIRTEHGKDTDVYVDPTWYLTIPTKDDVVITLCRGSSFVISPSINGEYITNDDECIISIARVHRVHLKTCMELTIEGYENG